MKFSLLAIVGVASASNQEKLYDLMNLQVESQGVPIHMDGNTWRRPWPQGYDNSENDDKILNWIRKPAGPPPAIKYHDKMRHWEKGTWPVNFSWNSQMDHATYHNEIDDGTDDNEVVDVQLNWASGWSWISNRIMYKLS